VPGRNTLRNGALDDEDPQGNRNRCHYFLGH
jgi:hypothetical protein